MRYTGNWVEECYEDEDEEEGGKNDEESSGDQKTIAYEGLDMRRHTPEEQSKDEAIKTPR